MLFLLIVPGTTLGVIPYLLITSDYNVLLIPLGPFRYVGMGLCIVGIMGMLWCVWNFIAVGRGTPAPIDPPRELVITGPYRFVRNPMYIAAITILIGEVLLYESVLLFVYLLFVALGFHLFIIFYEEPKLRSSFPEGFNNYTHRVPRWIPRLPL